jgi:hypothetical protein
MLSRPKHENKEAKEAKEEKDARAKKEKEGELKKKRFSLSAAQERAAILNAYKYMQSTDYHKKHTAALSRAYAQQKKQDEESANEFKQMAQVHTALHLTLSHVTILISACQCHRAAFDVDSRQQPLHQTREERQRAAMGKRAGKS